MLKTDKTFSLSTKKYRSKCENRHVKLCVTWSTMKMNKNKTKKKEVCQTEVNWKRRWVRKGRENRKKRNNIFQQNYWRQLYVYAPLQAASFPSIFYIWTFSHWRSRKFHFGFHLFHFQSKKKRGKKWAKMSDKNSPHSVTLTRGKEKNVDDIDDMRCKQRWQRWNKK